MINLEALRKKRIDLRNHFRGYSRDNLPWGIILNVDNESCISIKDKVVSYFQSQGFKIEFENAPSPTGILDGYKVYISSIVANDSYDIVSLCVSIHHKDEDLVSREERSNYCY